MLSHLVYLVKCNVYEVSVQYLRFEILESSIRYEFVYLINLQIYLPRAT